MWSQLSLVSTLNSTQLLHRSASCTSSISSATCATFVSSTFRACQQQLETQVTSIMQGEPHHTRHQQLDRLPPPVLFVVRRGTALTQTFPKHSH
jgi:hypothetical protein